MKATLLAGALATCALWSLAPSAALANVLSSGNTGVAPDTFAAPSTFTILTSAPERAFSSVDFDFIADLFEAVISDPTNVFGAGDLDFIIVVGNDNDLSRTLSGSPRPRSLASRPMWVTLTVFLASPLTPSID